MQLAERDAMESILGVRRIEKGSKKNASRFAVELKDHLARELRRLTAPHFLRRLKSEARSPPAP